MCESAEPTHQTADLEPFHGGVHHLDAFLGLFASNTATFISSFQVH